MSSVFNKLNLKSQTEIVVLNSPESFESELKTIGDITILRNVSDAKEINFSLAFVTKQKEVDSLAKAVAKKAKGDAVIWFAFPKGTSKKYKCEFNRDSGWASLGEAGFEGVRLVAIDEDWSAMRFRRVEFIKTMSRDKSRAMTKEGKLKPAKKQTPSKST